MAKKLCFALSLLGLLVLANSKMAIKKRGFSEDMDAFVSQTKELSKQMVELAKMNTKLSFQNSIASLNFTQNQLLEDINKIDKNEFSKPTMLQFKGDTIFFDGKKFTDGFFKQLNETETKEAFQVLKQKLTKTLESVKSSSKNIEDNLNQFD